MLLCCWSKPITKTEEESRDGRPRGSLYLSCLLAKQMAVWREPLVLRILVHFVWSPNTELNLWRTDRYFCSQADIKIILWCLAATCGIFFFFFLPCHTCWLRHLRIWLSLCVFSVFTKHTQNISLTTACLIPLFSCKVRGDWSPTAGVWDCVPKIHSTNR